MIRAIRIHNIVLRDPSQAWPADQYPHNGIFQAQNGQLIMVYGLAASRAVYVFGETPTIDHFHEGGTPSITYSTGEADMRQQVQEKDKQINSLMELLKGAQEIILDVSPVNPMRQRTTVHFEGTGGSGGGRGR